MQKSGSFALLSEAGCVCEWFCRCGKPSDSSSDVRSTWTGLPCGLGVPPLGICPRGLKTYLYKNLYVNIYSNTVYSNQNMEQLEDSATDEHSSAMKRNEVPIHATMWMNPEDIMLSERRQT